MDKPRIVPFGADIDPVPSAEVDIAVSLFNTSVCGYSLSPELIARIADIENIFCIKNPQPVEHTLKVLRTLKESWDVVVPN